MLQSSSTHHKEYLKQKRKRKILKYALVVLFFLILLSLTSYISHRQRIRVSKVELTGQVLVNEKDVENQTLSYLSGSYLWLFPKNNAFLYPKKSLSDFLKNNFKRIDNINIRLNNFNVLEIAITERKPFAIWCEQFPSGDSASVTREKCFFMDSNSTIFSEAPNFSGNAYFKYYGLINVTEPVGLEYMSSTTLFADIVRFVDTAKKLSLKPLYIVGKDKGEFSLVLSQGGEIYFDTREPISKVEENLQALMRTAPFETMNKKPISIDYIDLRYGNKLFYKLK